MKLYNREPLYLIRLQITQQKQKTEYVNLSDTTLDEVKEWIISLIEAQHISPFEKNKTSVNIREAVGGKNGKGFNISFRGLTPEETKKLIIDSLQSKQVTPI